MLLGFGFGLCLAEGQGRDAQDMALQRAGHGTARSAGRRARLHRT